MLSEFIYKKLFYKRDLLGYSRVRENLSKLYPECDIQQLCEEYYRKKIKESLLVLAIGLVISLMMTENVFSAKTLINGNEIARKEFDGGKTNVDVRCDIDGQLYNFNLEIMPRTLSEKEVEDYYNSFIQNLEELILGENDSFSNITKPLKLYDNYDAYPFEIVWESSDTGVLSNTGEIVDSGNERNIELKATITYESYMYEKIISLGIGDQTISEREVMEKNIKDLIDSNDEKTRYGEELILPEEIDGKKIVWEETVNKNAIILIVLSVITAILIFFLKDKDLVKDMDIQRKQMQRDYPVIVNKLVLYVSAGMTIRNAFFKIGADYESRKNEWEDEGYIYREILIMCREMQTGLSEGAAYEKLGRKTGLNQYVKLTTLLIQNLKKGNTTLIERLQEENCLAIQDRIQRSRRVGEEASTKLLIPMTMLLALVMILVMVPAFMQMSV